MADLGYNYLYYQRKFINADQDVYKVGWTRDLMQRPKNYPKGGRYVFTRLTTDFIEIEDVIKREFASKYIQRRDFGTEYFEGNHQEMIDDMTNIIERYNTFRKETTNNDRKVEIKKTLHHFCEETLISDPNSSGIHVNALHDYYVEWLKNNSVDIAYYNLDEFIDKLSKIIGKPVKNLFKGQSWSDKVDINMIPDYKQNSEDLWLEFREKYLIQDAESYIQWKDLREKFRSWHDGKFTKKISKRGDDVKKYFEKYLGGFYKTSKQGVSIKGFTGWKYIS